MSVGHHSKKFNIVSNDHGRTQKCDFCVSVSKTNFTDHHTPGTINGFRDSVLVCKIHDCYCTICKNFEYFHSVSFLLIRPFHQTMQAIAMVRISDYSYEIKPLQNVFKQIRHYIYFFKLYSVSIIFLLKNNLTNICGKIHKIGMNLWMAYLTIWKALEITKWVECTLHCWLKSWEICGFTRQFYEFQRHLVYSGVHHRKWGGNTYPGKKDIIVRN